MSTKTKHPLDGAPGWERVTRAQLEAEDAWRYQFAFIPGVDVRPAQATNQPKKGDNRLTT